MVVTFVSFIVIVLDTKTRWIVVNEWQFQNEFLVLCLSWCWWCGVVGGAVVLPTPSSSTSANTPGADHCTVGKHQSSSIFIVIYCSDTQYSEEVPSNAFSVCLKGLLALSHFPPKLNFCHHWRTFIIYYILPDSPLAMFSSNIYTNSISESTHEILN